MAEKYHHSALPIGTMLRDYCVEEVLGHGGFGITYKARHETLKNQVVAIKEYLPNDLSIRDEGGAVYPKSSGSDEEHYQWGLARFIQEAQTLANFNHRNIIRILTFFKENNTAYLVMEYENGKNLKTMYSEFKGQIHEQTLLNTVVLPLLYGLKVMHDENVLHRDIKPENIYVRNDSSPVLLDFGSARQSVSGKSRSLSAIVTPGFAPWEQYSTKGRQGPWTDIYSFGAVLYWLIGGTPVDASDRTDAKVNELPDPFVPAQEIGRGRYSTPFLRAIDHALRMLGRDRPQSVEAWLPEFSVLSQPDDAAETRTRELARFGIGGHEPQGLRKTAVAASEAKTRRISKTRKKKAREQLGGEDAHAGSVETGQTHAIAHANEPESFDSADEAIDTCWLGPVNNADNDHINEMLALQKTKLKQTHEYPIGEQLQPVSAKPKIMPDIGSTDDQKANDLEDETIDKYLPVADSDDEEDITLDYENNDQSNQNDDLIVPLEQLLLHVKHDTGYATCVYPDDEKSNAGGGGVSMMNRVITNVGASNAVGYLKITLLFVGGFISTVFSTVLLGLFIRYLNHFYFFLLIVVIFASSWCYWNLYKLIKGATEFPE